MPKLADTLSDDARAAIGRALILLAQIGARQEANAAEGTAAFAAAERSAVQAQESRP